MFSSGEVEILPLYEVKLAAEVTVANMVSDLKNTKTHTENNSNKSAISADEWALQTVKCFRLRLS